MSGVGRVDDALRRVDALFGVGLRLARSAPSGRVLLAQLAAGIDSAWIPRPWGDDLAAELEAAQRSALEPVSAKQIERALRDAWGARATDVLDDLDTEPAAVTPTSQVHRGVLDGTPVAVKVLRPGMARSVSQDLALLDSLLGPLGAAFPALDARAVVRETRERVLDELDLEHEASAQRRFHRALRGHPWLVVPAPVMGLVHAGVLVSEWVDGSTLWDAPDRDQAAARLVRFGLGGAVAGFMHSDLNPDDVLVRPDGRLAVLDFGAWCEVDRDRLALVTAMVDAFVDGDSDGFSSLAERLGWLPVSRGLDAFELIGHALDGLTGPGPARLDRDTVLTVTGRLGEHSDAVARIVVAGALPAQDLWPARAVAQLFGTIARIGATGRWSELIRGTLRDGWAAAEA
jgi:predicted unusual protein kinase regulating ubiquinone biosynthesis (AarF/ABC1/UbiB family)